MTTTPRPTTPPLRFDPRYEQPAGDEADTEQSIEATLRKIQEKTFADGAKGIRGVHAKSHGLLVGELLVLPGLPAHLAQGLFARPGQWPVVMRLSTSPGDLLPDNVSTPRGMALKVIGIDGARLPGSEGDVTQDFVMINGPAFSNKNAKAFGANLKMLAATTDRMEGTKQALSAALRGAEKIVEAVGGQSATLMSLGGHPETHPLGETYYSQVPILFGDYFGKVCVRPYSPDLQALHKAPVDLKDKPDGLRKVVSDHFVAKGGEWEICVQLCTDIDKMPVEDASVVWNEEESPYVAVGRVLIPPQPTYDDARVRGIDQGLAFSPWHGIAAHRPLGSVMRVRRLAYEHAQRLRAEQSGRVLREPRSIDDVQRIA